MTENVCVQHVGRLVCGLLCDVCTVTVGYKYMYCYTLTEKILLFLVDTRV